RPADDVYQITFVVDQVNGSVNGYFIEIDGLRKTEAYSYGVTTTLTVPADNKKHQIKAIDAEDSACSKTNETSVLVPCSNECLVEATADQILCSDEGTPESGDDDTYSFRLNVLGENTGGSKWFIEGTNTAG